jgi:hypothetical protein
MPKLRGARTVLAYLEVVRPVDLFHELAERYAAVNGISRSHNRISGSTYMAVT